MPEMDALARWLSDHLPPNPPAPAIVHGDFKLDNLMIDPEDRAALSPCSIGR